MHDDHDCHLWVESEGSLLPESKQFGPWLKAAPFVPNQKYVVKVPGFFARKKVEAAKEKLETVKNKPVVVVRTGKRYWRCVGLKRRILKSPTLETRI